jgi:4-hydroxy-tetrahydrodipicolinate synthase
MARSVCSGIVIPLITPFDDTYQVDLEALDSLVDFSIGSGVHGLFLAGSSGMGPVLNVAERKAVCESGVRRAGHRVPVIVMVGAPDTETTIELGQHAKRTGADAIASLPPYYYTDHSESEVLKHFRKLADSVDLPIYIYQNPRYTGIDIKASLAKQIAETIPSICGIKVSHGSLDDVLRYVKAMPKETGVFSGPLLNLFPGYQLGIRGSISPPTSLFPELAVSYWNSIVNERYEETLRLAKQVWPVVSLMMGGGTGKLRSYLAMVAKQRGLPVKHYPRWETDGLSEKDVSDIQALLSNLGLVKTVAA